MEARKQIEVTTSTEGAGIFAPRSLAWEAERNLLVRAINNRTRERNYANLCLRLAEGEISDREFEEEITRNEHNYVISFDNNASREEIIIAAGLTTDIIDVKTEDDFKELFSLSTESMFHLPKPIEYNGQIH